MKLTKRGLFGGALAFLAAPAIIRTPGLLMPVVRPLELRVERFGMTYDGPGSPLDNLDKTRARTRIFPDWITLDTPCQVMIIDHGYARRYAWRRETHARS